MTTKKKNLHFSITFCSVFPSLRDENNFLPKNLRNFCYLAALLCFSLKYLFSLSLKNSDKALWKNRSAFTQEVELNLQTLASRDGLSIEYVTIQILSSVDTHLCPFFLLLFAIYIYRPQKTSRLFALLCVITD